jgi:transcription factor E2F3
MVEKSKHSLVELTQAFVSLLTSANGEEVDLGMVEGQIGASKRRLYDVTNVLAGIGVIERCGKARVRWIGGGSGVDNGSDLKDLLARESELDRVTAEIDEALANLAASPDFHSFAWVSEEDVARLADRDLTLFALRGPSDLLLEVPESEDPARHRLICTSQTGAVDLIPIRQAGKEV